MYSSGLLSLHNSARARSIIDPDVAVKLSGKKGRNAFADELFAYSSSSGQAHDCPWSVSRSDLKLQQSRRKSRQ